ncbi:FAD-binding oxidoreductase [Sphingobium sp. SCG-1]|uniref:NAD(P)/FAD-dependent oxidoreductase n=1 Tax=Sphingobium sp. SCG-1 TaxID=2072936 RepID=UPI000CD6C1E3|nr:FAD-binding oxidoreductase [Sphingobium sp. SCG-1]AUW57802.1 FAD-binding oxidoreductase [Sphingobium sp. SCG-1]
MTAMTRREISLALASAIAALPLAPARASERKRVIVIGAGIMGASISYHLAARGAEVVILDKAQPGSGATQGSFAWINAYARDPLPYYDLHVAGILGWQRLALEIGPALRIQWGGSVEWVGEDLQAEALKVNALARARMGLSVRLVDPVEIGALLPGVRTGPVAAAAFCENEATLDPSHATNILLEKAQAHGAKLVYPCDVTELRATGGRVQGIMTNRGEMNADHFVLASGFPSAALAQQIGVDASLVEGSGVLAHSKAMAPIIDRVVLLPKFSIKQNPDGRIVAGYHFAGSRSLAPTEALGRQMFAEAAAYFPKMRHAELDFMTVGRPAWRKDGLATAGTVRSHLNLFVAVMNNGLTMAPIIGQLAAIEILDGVQTAMLDPYRA